MFGLFNRSKNTVKNPRCLIATIGGQDNTFVADDRRIYEGLFGDVETFEAESLSAFREFLSTTSIDILHLFANITDDRRIEGASGPEFFKNISEANVKIFILASENPGDDLIPFCSEAVNAGAAPMNLVMTLDRKGDSFGRFFKSLFGHMVSGGKTMPQAWVELSPQGTTSEIDAPETVFSAGFGSLRLSVE